MTMLLTETINSSVSAIQRRRTAQERKQSTEAYTHALAHLNTTGESLKYTLECTSALTESQLTNQSPMIRQTRDDLLGCVNNCGQGLFDGSLTNDMVNILKTKSESLFEQIQIKWTNIATEYASGTLGYLSLICHLTNNPTKTIDLIEKIKNTINNRLSVESPNNLIFTVNEAKAITDSFSFNATIEGFLRKVSLQQATICDLSPEVFDWLKEKHLDNKIKLHF